jgi:parallel beta-helix repeat protein
VGTATYAYQASTATVALKTAYKNTLIVAKEGGHYQSISAALNSITDASEDNPYLIMVMPGIYVEQVNLKSYVDIRGSGIDSCIIKYTTDHVMIANSIGSCTISNLTIIAEGANNKSICCVNNSAPTIQNCKIKSTNNGGIYCSFNSAPTINGCIIEAYNDGIFCDNAGAPTIQDCKIKSTNKYGIYCISNSDPIISHCRIEVGGLDKSGIYLYDTSCNPKVYHCTIIATGTGNSIYGPSGTNIYCALCTMNKPISGNCVNPTT